MLYQVRHPLQLRYYLSWNLTLNPHVVSVGQQYFLFLDNPQLHLKQTWQYISISGGLWKLKPRFHFPLWKYWRVTTAYQFCYTLSTSHMCGVYQTYADPCNVVQPASVLNCPQWLKLQVQLINYYLKHIKIMVIPHIYWILYIRSQFGNFTLIGIFYPNWDIIYSRTMDLESDQFKLSYGITVVER